MHRLVAILYEFFIAFYLHFSGVIEEKDAVISNLRSSLQQMKKQHREEIEQNAGKLTDLLEKNTSLTDKVYRPLVSLWLRLVWH